jgi:hypothetical protein
MFALPRIRRTRAKMENREDVMTSLNLFQQYMAGKGKRRAVV